MVTMAQVLYRAVVQDEDFLAALGGPRLYVRGSLGRDGVPAEPPTPYAMYGEGVSAPFSATRRTSPDTAATDFTFYVYDDAGSFERIKAVLHAIRRAVEALDGTTTEEGMIVTEARWTSVGVDQFDQISKRNVINQTFRTVGRMQA